MLSIHTVFEGHDYQTTPRLRKFLKERDIRRLVGVDRHKRSKEIPETMRRYRTRGTPEMAIIDKHGNIRFQHFGGFNPEPVEKYIHKLLDEQYQVGSRQPLRYLHQFTQHHGGIAAWIERKFQLKITIWKPVPFQADHSGAQCASIMAESKSD